MIATTEKPAESRDEWLASRQLSIGSSDAPPILGCGYSGENAHTVWARKVGIADSGLEDSDRLLCGRMLQDGICKILAHKTNYDIRPAGEFDTVRSEEYPFLSATIDAEIMGDPRGPGVCEIKNVDHFLMKQWAGGEPPLRVAVQLQHQLLVTGRSWGICGAVVGGNRPVWFEMERHERLIAVMLPILLEFWRHVEGRTPPPVDATAACASALKGMFPQDSGESVELPSEAATWFDELTAVKEAEKWLDKRRTLLENRIKASLGTSLKGTLADGRSFTWKTQVANYEPQPARQVVSRVLRQHHGRGSKGIAGIPARMTEATARLMEAGGVLYAESDSGSRYFELPGGLRVRVADHAPNQKTAAWMDRREVASVRVDDPGWQAALAGIVGAAIE